MANREEGEAAPNWRQGQEQPQPQDAVRQRHIHLNWSNFNPEFLGKAEEDAETHLLHSNDWMDAHHFNKDKKVQKILSYTTGRSKTMVSFSGASRRNNMGTIAEFISAKIFKIM